MEKKEYILKTGKENVFPVQMNKLWNFFTSVKLTVAILLILAVTSIIGTLIPQNESPAAYIHEYGEFLYKIFQVLDIFDMYHSWWFQFLLLILTVNIIVCSANRLSATWKIIFVKTPSFVLSSFKKLAHKEEFAVEGSSEHLRKVCESFVSKKFAYRMVEETDQGVCVFGEKGRWTRVGVYIVHFSVVLLLLGGLTGSMFGFEGFVNIPEGEMTNRVRLRKSNQIHILDFAIQCDDFNVSFYDSGAPKEFRSGLTIIEQDKPVVKKNIIVNDPLRHKGISIFQSSYGALPPKEITLNFTSKATGMAYTQKVALGQQLDIPEGMGTFVFKRFDNSYDFMGHNIGEAVVGTLIREGQDPLDIAMPLRYPKFDMMRKGNVVISVEDYDRRYYTGLQITRDPGVVIVYTGFVVMIIGIFVTFFMSHQKICVELMEDEDKNRIVISGTANKGKMGMEIKVKRLSRELADLTCK